MGDRDGSGPEGLVNARRRMGPGDGYADDDDVSGHAMPEIPGASDGFAAAPRLPGRDRVAADAEDDVEGHSFGPRLAAEPGDGAGTPTASDETTPA
jgi:hypothetical protein